MQIRYVQKFIKMYAKAPMKVQQAFRQKLTLLLNDFYHPLLNNHQLTGKYQDCRSINITGDWRAIFKQTENCIYFRLIGTHSQLYK